MQRSDRDQNGLGITGKFLGEVREAAGVGRPAGGGVRRLCSAQLEVCVDEREEAQASHGTKRCHGGGETWGERSQCYLILRPLPFGFAAPVEVILLVCMSSPMYD